MIERILWKLFVLVVLVASIAWRFIVRRAADVAWYSLCAWIWFWDGRDQLKQDIAVANRKIDAELKRRAAEAERQDRLRNPAKYRLAD